MIRVLIADDHPIVRKGLRLILTGEPDLEVAEASTIPEVREAIIRQPPDILVLDVNMPGGSGLDYIGEVLQTHPRLPVLVLSIHPEEQTGVRAILAGARGYLNKDTAPEKLVEAVRRLMAGGRFVSAALGEALADYISRPPADRPPHEALSEREYTVMRRIAAGEATGEIATSLNLSPKTVSTYRSRILEKMRMTSNAELTRYVVERGLDPD